MVEYPLTVYCNMSFDISLELIWNECRFRKKDATVKKLYAERDIVNASKLTSSALKIVNAWTARTTLDVRRDLFYRLRTVLMRKPVSGRPMLPQLLLFCRQNIAI